MAELEITKDEALAAVRAAAWPNGQVSTCGHRGCEEHVEDGPLYIHVLSGFGMDMPLESVEEEIRSARRVYWVDQDDQDTAPWAWAMTHQLAAETADSYVYHYEVRRPEVSDDAA